MARKVIIALLIMLSVRGCMEEDLIWDFYKARYHFESEGVFVVNQGNFTYGNASLSYYDPLSGQVHNDVFFSANALPLGDVAQSMAIRDSLAYVVINNSGRIYVLHSRTFAYQGKITGLTSPRHIHFISDEKAYVSDLYARALTVVNPTTLSITGTIPLRSGNEEFYRHSTEEMIRIGRYVYVACWSYDNQVMVIDSETDAVIDSVEVIQQPNSMVTDRGGNLWILSDGGFEGSTLGSETGGLMKLSPGETEPQTVFRTEEGERPSALAINGSGDTLYYLNGHVYRMPVHAGAEPEIFIRSPYENVHSGGFYGLEVDPATSEVYVSDAIDFVQPGWVYRYSSRGTALDSFRVGIAPGYLCIRPAPVR